MARQRIRLTESQLNRVIKESVKSVLKEFDEFNEIDRAWYDRDTPNYLVDKIKMGTATEKEIMGAVRDGDSEVIDAVYCYASPMIQKKVDMELDWIENDKKMYGHISRDNGEHLGFPHGGKKVTSDNGNVFAAQNGITWGQQKRPFPDKENYINDINFNAYELSPRRQGRNAIAALSDDEEIRNIGRSIAPTIRQSYKNGQKFSKNLG